MNKICIIIVTIIFYVQVSAQIKTDRPDQTESSATVGKGDLQIESGILVAYNGSTGFSNRQILLPTNLFRYGLSEWIELRIINQFETRSFDFPLGELGAKFQGLSDLQIGTKIQLLHDDNKNSEIALLSHLVLPSGTIELSGDTFGTINKLCLSHSLSPKLGLGYNVGYSYFGENTGSLTYSVSLGVGINEKVGMFIEPYGEVLNFEETSLNFDAGFTYLLNHNLQFDFSFATGITQQMNYLSVGCSWLINPSVAE